LTVIGALERITLSPLIASRSPGSLQRYTATGHFGRQHTQNLTQDLVYSSSDPRWRRAERRGRSKPGSDAIAPGSVRSRRRIRRWSQHERYR
jgi:hypothetical protein